MTEKDTLGHIKNLKVKLKENLYEILHVNLANFDTELGSFAQNKFCAN